MQLDAKTMKRVEAIAGRAGNEAFKTRKRELLAEAVRLRQSGGNVERWLTHEELDALKGHFEEAAR